jgi:hypothetical protein
MYDEMMNSTVDTTTTATPTRATRVQKKSKSILVDGGPHTLWWSVQEPDGSKPKPVKPHDNGAAGVVEVEEEGVGPAPIALVLAQLQPGAKLVVTLAEPVKRGSIDMGGDGER